MNNYIPQASKALTALLVRNKLEGKMLRELKSFCEICTSYDDYALYIQQLLKKMYNPVEVLDFFQSCIGKIENEQELLHAVDLFKNFHNFRHEYSVYAIHERLKAEETAKILLQKAIPFMKQNSECIEPVLAGLKYI